MRVTRHCDVVVTLIGFSYIYKRCCRRWKILTLARIRAFNAVLETGGAASAARQLGISQPTVTQAIKDLERGAGLKLFERRGRDLVPTSVCADLHRLTRSISTAHLDAERLLFAHAKLGAGELRVGLGNAMPGMTLIREFKQRFPGINLEVELGDWRQIIEAVADSRVDVGVLPNVPEDGRFIRRICLKQYVVALVPEDWPIGEQGIVDCQALSAYPMIFRSKGSSTQGVVDRAFRQAGVKPIPSLVLDTREGMYEAVANGLGIGFMWHKGTSRTDRTRQIRVSELLRTYPEHIFHLANNDNALVRAFSSITL